MTLVEEIDYGLPWPSFDDDTYRPDTKMNMLIFEDNELALSSNKEYAEAKRKYLIFEESRKKVKKLVSERTRYVRKLVKIIFDKMTVNLKRRVENYYSRIITSLICIIGFKQTANFEIRIAVLSIASLISLLVKADYLIV